MTRDEYKLNPKHCIRCGAIIPFKKRINKFCTQSCAASYNNNKRITEGWKRSTESKLKTSQTIKSKPTKLLPCIKCGTLVTVASTTRKILCNNCRHARKYKYTYKYTPKFKDVNKRAAHYIFTYPNLCKLIGVCVDDVCESNIGDVFSKICNKLKSMYLDDQMSVGYIHKQINVNLNAINNILRYDCKIKFRTNQEANKLSILYARKPIIENPYIHHQRGWLRTWNGKNVYYRSSYEKEYIEQLNNQHVDFDTETIRILYFDTKKNRQRVAIPDIYISSTNTLVEIKSNYTLDLQNMKDKFTAYNNAGYKCKLILEHKEVDINTL